MRGILVYATPPCEPLRRIGLCTASDCDMRLRLRIIYSPHGTAHIASVCWRRVRARCGSGERRKAWSGPIPLHTLYCTVLPSIFQDPCCILYRRLGLVSAVVVMGPLAPSVFSRHLAGERGERGPAVGGLSVPAPGDGDGLFWSGSAFSAESQLCSSGVGGCGGVVDWSFASPAGRTRR